MAQNVHLFLKSEGNDIQGESTVTSLDRDGSIECISYDQFVQIPRESSTGNVTGRRQYAPLEIVKRVDKASPLLMKALVQNEKIDGVFKFYRPSMSGDGTTEQFYTVKLKEGHIASVKQYVPDTMDKGTDMYPPLEKVSFVFQTIEWTYEEGGVTHTDSWSGE